jgi:hypothetical protein
MGHLGRYPMGMWVCIISGDHSMQGGIGPLYY